MNELLTLLLPGCAFVTFTTRAMAQTAIKAMHQAQTMEVGSRLNERESSLSLRVLGQLAIKALQHVQHLIALKVKQDKDLKVKK